MAYKNSYRRQSQSRWMTLRYEGNCKVCGASVPAGETAFWDAGSHAITCHNIACCEADGLTMTEWRGSPVSGAMVTVRAPRRIGSAYSDRQGGAR